jgi:hypothetical protein
LAILGLFGLLFAMHLGYSLTLGKRTAKLEKKNGREQHEIDELKKEIKRLKNQNGMPNLPKEKTTP